MMGNIPKLLWGLLKPCLIRKGYVKVKVIRRTGIVNTYLANIKNKQEISFEGRTRNIKPDAILKEGGWPVIYYHEESPDPIPRHGEYESKIPPTLFNQLLEEHYEAGYARARFEMKNREKQAMLIIFAGLAIMGFMVWNLYTQQQQLVTQIQNMAKEIAKMAAALG